MTTFPRFNEQSAENRKRVVRMAVLYTPITVISLILVTLAIYKIATGETGFFVMLFVFGTLALLTGFQTVGYLKDLSSAPIEYQGEVVRKWHKGNLFIFFMPSFYLAVDSQSHTGRVIRVETHGCYVTMHHGAEGYLPRKEMDYEAAGDPTQSVSMGSEIRYKVLGVDKRGGYKLSQRRVEEGEYITKLFSITRNEYAMLLERDLVKITCYPHSNTVERLDRYDEIEKKFIPATDGANS
jgi:predicted RNA-binding protein with RPS1 domain